MCLFYEIIERENMILNCGRMFSMVQWCCVLYDYFLLTYVYFFEFFVLEDRVQSSAVYIQSNGAECAARSMECCASPKIAIAARYDFIA